MQTPTSALWKPQSLSKHPPNPLQFNPSITTSLQSMKCVRVGIWNAHSKLYTRSAVWNTRWTLEKPSPNRSIKPEDSDNIRHIIEVRLTWLSCPKSHRYQADRCSLKLQYLLLQLVVIVIWYCFFTNATWIYSGNYLGMEAYIEFLIIFSIRSIVVLRSNTLFNLMLKYPLKCTLVGTTTTHFCGFHNNGWW